MSVPSRRRRRTRAEVDAIRQEAREELAQGHPMTLRQVHYRIVARGFDGWSSLKNAADRYGDGEGVTVLYFGDFDPSGEDMVRSLRERLAEPDLPNGGSEPEIIKCALTFEDIERYQLPPDFTKTTDSRRDAFVERYGDVAVELDALPGEVLRSRLVREVEARMDLEALERTREAERQDKERLTELLGGAS